jgi:sugar phosphate isomerase/epimerase
VPAPRIAIQLRSLNLPFAKALSKVRALGVHAVEIDARTQVRPQELTETGLREIRKQLNDNELRVVAVEFHTRRGYGVADELDRRVEATKAAMHMARSLGCDLVVNQVGHIPADLTTGEGKMLVEVLNDLAHYSQHAGAWLAAETGSEPAADLRRLLDTLPEGGMAVTLDPGNLVMNGFDPIEAVATLNSAIRHVHVKDAARDLARRRGVEVQLGRGSVDFPVLLGALEERDYRGYLSIEREVSDDPLGDVAAAVEYLRNM